MIYVIILISLIFLLVVPMINYNAKSTARKQLSMWSC